MGILINALLFLLGLLAAQTWVLSKFGGAKGLIDKLIPIQRYLGIVGLVIGVFLIIDTLKVLNFISFQPIRVLLAVATCVLLILLGLLYGYDLLHQYVLSKSQSASGAGSNLKTKLAGVQVQLGLAGMVVAILSLLSYLMSPI